MITRVKIISIVLLLPLLVMGCASLVSIQNDLQTTSTEQIPMTTQTSITGVTIPSKPTSTQLENQDAKEVLDKLKYIEESFTQAIKTTHWIQQISTQNIYMEQTQTYMNFGVLEEWYRFDAGGELVEYYNWLTSPADCTPEQESCLVDGRMYNVTMGTFGRSETRPAHIDFTGGFAERFKNGKNQKHEQVEYQGKAAEKFSYEMKEGIFEFVHVIYFDSATHYILGRETWRKESDDSTKLVSSMVISTFVVDADPPLAHFQQILDQVPEE